MRKFLSEQKFNKQNDKVYAGISYQGQCKSSQNSKRSPPIFCDGLLGSVVEWSYCDLSLHVRSKNDQWPLKSMKKSFSSL